MIPLRWGSQDVTVILVLLFVDLLMFSDKKDSFYTHSYTLYLILSNAEFNRGLERFL